MLFVYLISTVLACYYKKDARSDCNRNIKCPDGVKSYSEKRKQLWLKQREVSENDDTSSDGEDSSINSDDCKEYHKQLFSSTVPEQNDDECDIKWRSKQPEDVKSRPKVLQNRKAPRNRSISSQDQFSYHGSSHPERSSESQPSEIRYQMRAKRRADQINPSTQCNCQQSRNVPEVNCMGGQNVLVELKNGCMVYPGFCVVHSKPDNESRV